MNFAVGQEFRSQQGAGQDRARIVSINGNKLTLIRWKNTESGRPSPRSKAFTLTVAYMSSPGCGWTRV